MEELPAGWTIADVQLDVLAEVPRAKQSDFIRATISAKTSCTISRLLKTNISMSAKLGSAENHGTKGLRRRMDSLKVSETKKQGIGEHLLRNELPKEEKAVNRISFGRAGIQRKE
jgi:hypothetical protein